MTPRTGRVVAATLAQLLLVGVAVWAPLSARLTGEKVRLRVETVDPVDAFRGAYLDLSYPDLPGSSGRGDGAVDAGGPRGTAYVVLRREGEVWVGGPVRRSPPPDGTYLRCDDSSWQLRCGIESLFLPQDEARAVQDALRTGTAVATVRVDSRGHAALVDVAAAP